MIFIHIPKTGGISLRGIFKNYNHITVTEHLHGMTQKPKEFTFAVSRNPYTRVLSSYNYLCTGGDQSPNDMAYKEKLFVNMLDNVKDFHYFVKNMLKNLIYKQVHFLPMTSFISSGNNILIDIYFKLEELSANWEDIKKIINVEGKLIKANPSKKIKNKDKWLTDEVKDIIYNLYKIDFENFEYEKEFNG